jgi:type III secretion protein R
MEDQGLWGRPLYLLGALVAVSLLPFVGMMVTSFVKIAVVLSLTRQAIGTPQAPPTTVITGLAIILSAYVMYPVGYAAYEKVEPYLKPGSHLFSRSAELDINILGNALSAAKEPLKTFLREQATTKNIQLFKNLSNKSMAAASTTSALSEGDFMVLVPAFVISELTKAFQIGFVIFLPFLVVDMVVANILMALGMQMLSPTTVSLPFKILLFVLVDGWHLITRGLISGYVS